MRGCVVPPPIDARYRRQALYENIFEHRLRTGIGVATAERFASEGFDVVLTGRNVEKLANLSVAEYTQLRSLHIDKGFLQTIFARDALWRGRSV
jgi:hypothetical protein